jgi:hypothetical protein
LIIVGEFDMRELAGMKYGETTFPHDLSDKERRNELATIERLRMMHDGCVGARKSPGDYER